MTAVTETMWLDPRLYESEIVNYTLTIVAATALLANLAVMLLHATKTIFRPRHVPILWLVVIIDFGNALLALSLLLVILSRDIPSTMLCDIGGHLLLFCLQGTLWCNAFQIIVVCNLLRWKLRIYRNQCISRTMMLCCVISLWLISGLLTFLPMSRANYFSNVIEYSYRCIVVKRLDGVAGYEYGLFLFSLNWLVELVLIGLLLHAWFTKTANYKVPQLPDKIADERSVYLLYLQVDGSQLLLIQILSVFLILLPKSLGAAVVLRWIYLSCTASLSLGHAICSLPGLCIARKLFSEDESICDTTTWTRSLQSSQLTLRDEKTVPDSLLEIQALSDVCTVVASTQIQSVATTQSSGIFAFKVSWATNNVSTKSCQDFPCDSLTGTTNVTLSDDGSGTFGVNAYTGCLRAFVYKERHKWMWEMSAAKKLSKVQHPNIARYLWITKKNNFHAALACICPEKIDARTRLICRQHYPLGNFRSFLNRNINHVTEGTLHLVALDIANALSHLHTLNLLHNNLSSSCVYVKSSFESAIVNVVLADFELSQELQEPKVKINGVPQQLQNAVKGTISNVTGLSHRTGLLEAVRRNMFAADIRSYALFLLEIVLVYAGRQIELRRRNARLGKSKSNNSLISHRDRPRHRAPTRYGDTCSSSVFLANCSVSQTCLNSTLDFGVGSSTARTDMTADEIYEQIRHNRSSNYTTGRSKRTFRNNVKGVARSVTPESVLEAAEEEAAAAAQDYNYESGSGTGTGTAFQNYYQNIPLVQSFGGSAFRIQGVFSPELHTSNMFTAPAGASPLRPSANTNTIGNSTSDCDSTDVRTNIPPLTTAQHHHNPQIHLSSSNSQVGFPEDRILTHICEDETLSWPGTTQLSSDSGAVSGSGFPNSNTASHLASYNDCAADVRKFNKQLLPTPCHHNPQIHLSASHSHVGFPESSTLTYICEDETLSWPGATQLSSDSASSSVGRPDLLKSARSATRIISPLEEAPFDTPRLLGLSQHHVQICQRLLSEHPRRFDYTAILSGHRTKMHEMLQSINEAAVLQILTKNLTFMVEEAWLSEPSTGADALVDHLKNVFSGGSGSSVSSV